MEIFIVVACLASVVGGIGTIAGRLVYKAYSEELDEVNNEKLLPSSPGYFPTSSTHGLEEVKKN